MSEPIRLVTTYPLILIGIVLIVAGLLERA